jgi:hypothetical protein
MFCIFCGAVARFVCYVWYGEFKLERHQCQSCHKVFHVAK